MITNLRIDHRNSILELSIEDDGVINIDIINPDDPWEGCANFRLNKVLDTSLVIDSFKKLQKEQLKIYKENQT